MNLRPYQEDVIYRVRSRIAAGIRRLLIVVPTGGGKTVMFSNITEGAARKSKKVNLLVHRDTLLTQTSATLTRQGVEHGLIAAGYTPSVCPVQVSSIWTLVRRLTLVGAPDIIIMDEAHHAAAGAWLKVIEAWPNAVILGFTATPERLDGKGLGDIFQEIIEGPQVGWLMDQGYLTRARYIGVPPDQQLDLSGIRTTASGDYNADKVAELADKPHITGCAIKHYLHFCAGQPAVTFVANLAQGRHVREQFNAAGIKSEILDGAVETGARKAMVADLAAGRIKNIISCEIINEGFDLPVCAVAILLRPTESLSLHLQQIGRILRVVYAEGFDLSTREGRLAAIAAGPKPFAFVLDHVGNMKHGRAELKRLWSLDGADARKKKKRLEEAALANRQCPSCFSITAPAPKCPCCGYVFTVKERQIQQVDGSLTELTETQLDAIYLEGLAKKKARAQVGKAKTREQLEAIAEERGYKASWVDHMLAAKDPKAIAARKAKKLSQQSA
jgi:superfamily II DNA or RNA helicase